MTNGEEGWGVRKPPPPPTLPTTPPPVQVLAPKPAPTRVSEGRAGTPSPPKPSEPIEETKVIVKSPEGKVTEFASEAAMKEAIAKGLWSPPEYGRGFEGKWRGYTYTIEPVKLEVPTVKAETVREPFVKSHAWEMEGLSATEAARMEAREALMSRYAWIEALPGVKQLSEFKGIFPKATYPPATLIRESSVAIATFPERALKMGIFFGTGLEYGIFKKREVWEPSQAKMVAPLALSQFKGMAEHPIETAVDLALTAAIFKGVGRVVSEFKPIEAPIKAPSEFLYKAAPKEPKIPDILSAGKMKWEPKLSAWSVAKTLGELELKTLKPKFLEEGYSFEAFLRKIGGQEAKITEIRESIFKPIVKTRASEFLVKRGTLPKREPIITLKPKEIKPPKVSEIPKEFTTGREGLVQIAKMKEIAKPKVESTIALGLTLNKVEAQITKIKQKQLSAIKPIYFQTIQQKQISLQLPKQMPKQAQAPMQKLIQVPKLVEVPISKQMMKPIELETQISKQKPIPILYPEFKMKIPEPKMAMAIPRPEGLIRGFKFKEFKPMQPLRYKPSLLAFAWKIRAAKAPKMVYGFEIRPIVRGGRRVKRRKR